MAVIPKPYRKFKPASRPGPARSEARQRVLAQWRGVDLEPIKELRTTRATRADALVPGLLSKWGVDRRQFHVELLKVWNSSLDPRIAAHAQPINLHEGTLFVAVDSSAWLSEIVRYRRREILDRLQHSFGSERIARISFRVA